MSKVYFPLIYQVFTFNLPLIIYSDIQCIIGGNKFIDEETRLKMTLISWQSLQNICSQQNSLTLNLTFWFSWWTFESILLETTCDEPLH